MRSTVLWQRFEGALVFVAALIVLSRETAGLTWWAVVLIFLAPDISMAFFALGSRVGAFAYNAVHIYGMGAFVMALGMALGTPLVAVVGVLWLAHVGFDRMLGYGLKSPEGFNITHLGRIGRRREG